MSSFIGLSNPSNYCYGNSLLQQLFHIPAFRNDVMRLTSIELFQSEGMNTAVKPRKFDTPEKRDLIIQTLITLCDLFQQLTTSNEPQNIHDFYQSLILTLDLKPSLQEEMRDVSEFFSELIKILLLSTGKSLEISSPVLDLSKYCPNDGDERFLQDHLGGEFTYTIQPLPLPTPDTTETVDLAITTLKLERKERFYYISLNLHHSPSSSSSLPVSSKQSKKPITLFDSLSLFFQCKSFNYKWKHPVTSEMMSLPSSQSVKIQSTSNSIVFYLRRFQFNWKTNEKEKFFQPFLFSYSVDFSPYLSSSSSSLPSPVPVYRVNGLILHLGDDTEEGHYISLIYRDGGEVNISTSDGNRWLIGSRWMLFDDHRVEEVVVEYEDEIYDKETSPTNNTSAEVSSQRKIALEEIEENVVMLFYIKQ